MDVVVASAFVLVHTFDHSAALWAVLLILPLEGAILFDLRGALTVWGAGLAVYAGREAWGSGHYDYAFSWNSIGFRMGIGLLIALVAGLMARDLNRERMRLAAAVDRLHRVDRFRSALISALAHDVRSPLATIRGAAQLVLAGGDAIGPEESSRLLRSIDRQADRLTRMATDLLDLARREEGRLDLDLTECALREAVERTLSFADPDQRFRVEVDPGLIVRADPGRMDQMIFNLADNALRHGGPPFVVDAGCDEGYVVMSVRDHGPGVPPERQEALFDPFREGSGPGAGYGLTLVRVLAEAHGGRAGYEPNRPHGACFSVWLPSAGARAPAGGSPERQEVTGRM